MKLYKITKHNSDDFLLYVVANCKLDAISQWKRFTNDFWNDDIYKIDELIREDL